MFRHGRSPNFPATFVDGALISKRAGSRLAIWSIQLSRNFPWLRFPMTGAGVVLTFPNFLCQKEDARCCVKKCFYYVVTQYVDVINFLSAHVRFIAVGIVLRASPASHFTSPY